MIYEDQVDLSSYCGEISRVSDQFLRTVMQQSSNLIASILPLATIDNKELYIQFFSSFSSLINQYFFQNTFKCAIEKAEQYFRNTENQHYRDGKIRQSLKCIIEKYSTQLDIMKMIDEYTYKVLLNTKDKKNQGFKDDTSTMLSRIDETVSHLATSFTTISNETHKMSKQLCFIQNSSRQIIDVNSQLQSSPISVQSKMEHYQNNLVQKQLIEKDESQSNLNNRCTLSDTHLVKKKKKSNEFRQIRIQIKDCDDQLLISSQAKMEIQLRQLRDKITNQLNKINSRLQNINLFERDKQKFKLCFQDQNDIKSKLNKSNKTELKQLFQETQKMKVECQQMCLNMEQTCYHHRQTVYYLCLNQYLKKQIYMCNQCILKISNDIDHLKLQIECKKHRKLIIKYRQYNKAKQDSSVNYQIFLCSQCIQKKSLDKRLKLTCISLCHFAPITHLCLHQACIKDNIFKICPICQQSNHIDHIIVPFQEKSLMQQLAIQSKYNIVIFQELFIDTRERLKLHPIKKAIDSYVKELWNRIKYLEAFMVGSNRQVEKWVNCVIEEGNMEDMYVLWGVRQLKRRNYEQKQRLCYLQVFNDSIKRQLQQFFTSFSMQLNKLRNKIDELTTIRYQEVQARLNKKYEKIVNIEWKDEIIEIPCRLESVKNIHLNRVQAIQINNGEDQNYREIIDNQLKNERIRFFKNEVWQMFKAAKLPMILQKQIFTSLIKSQQLSNYRFRPQLFNHQNEDCKQAIQILKGRLEIWLKSYTLQRQKLHQCRILNLIAQKQLTNLKIIRIKYSIKKDTLFEDYYYSMPAFRLFEIINNNRQLQQFSIRGIYIKQLQQFIREFKELKSNHRQSKTYAQHGMYNYLKDVKLQQSDYDRKNREKWIKQFNPKYPIQLTINGVLLFDLNVNNIMEEIENLQFFLGYFNSVSEISVFVDCKKQPKQYIKYFHPILILAKQLIQQLKKIKRLALNISGLYFSTEVLKILFEELSQSTNISKIIFQNLNFSTMKSSFLENLIRDVLKNNSIIHLGIYLCKKFPKFPQIPTLQSIQIESTTFKRYPKIPMSIKSIIIEQQLSKIIYKKIKLKGIKIKNFDRIQTLRISSENFHRNSLLNLNCHNIKQLTLTHFGEHQINILKQVFLKLFSLTKLYLWNINCMGQIILLIPSQQLRQLKLFGNSQITNDCFQAIDSKWPYLKTIIIWKCPKVDERMFSKCKFKALINLVVHDKMLQQTHSTLHYLKQRGIQVQTWK